MLEGEKRILIPMLVYGIETRDERHNIFKDFNQIFITYVASGNYLRSCFVRFVEKLDYVLSKNLKNKRRMQISCLEILTGIFCCEDRMLNRGIANNVE